MYSMTKQIKIYKIRNKNTGEYYKNCDGKFSKSGKLFFRLCDCITSLKYYIETHENIIPVDWEIVEYDTIESHTFPAYTKVKGALSSDDAIIKSVIE